MTTPSPAASINEHNETSVLEPPPKRIRASVLCPHCDQYISKSTYYRHRSVFYNKSRKQWSQTEHINRSITRCSSDNDSISDYNDWNDDLSESESIQGNGNDGDDCDTLNSYDGQCATRMLGDEDQVFFSSSSDSDDDLDNLLDAPSTQFSSSDDESDNVEAQPATGSIPQPLYFFILLLLFWKAAFRISASSITAILRIIKYFLKLLGTAYDCAKIVDISHQIPVTLTSIERIARLENQSFTEYVVCPQCSVIYEFRDCIRVSANGTSESKTCRHVAYPNHPHRSKRNACGAMLLKKQTNSRKSVLAPIKVYPYRSVKKSMHQLLSKPGFVEKSEQWRKRMTVMPNDILGDVYDGEVWKQFSTSDYNHFLEVPYSYLVTLNVDWFQPFKRTIYSTGAIYLTLQNLPRDVRYRHENVLLVGMLPGPKEPRLNMNSYLTPLVEELHEFWNGVIIPVNVSGTTMLIRVRVALTCVACDIPASRKVCGFIGHGAKLGCNKCYKEFVTRDHKTDFSGFDRDNWTLRTNQDHRHRCSLLHKEVTPTSIQNLESSLGVRYSILLALPYFDPVRFTVIDPMHNLFLGTGKYSFKIWIDNGLCQIEKNVRSFKHRYWSYWLYS